MSKITLLYNQIEHFDRINSILSLTSNQNNTSVSNGGFYFDNSETGAGKTYVTIKIAEKREVKGIFVLCPVSVIGTWQYVSKLAIIPIIEIMSYEKFRGTNKYPPKHKYVNLIPKIKEYKIGEKTKEITKDKILFIFDECHRLKNDTIQSRSVAALTRYIHKYTNSDLAFLTATKYDKTEHAFNMFKTLGLTDYSKMFRYYLGENRYELLGIDDIKKYSEKLYNIHIQYPSKINKKMLEMFCHSLLTTYIYPKISSAMKKTEFPTTIKNIKIVPDKDISEACKNIVKKMYCIIEKNGKFDYTQLSFFSHLLDQIKVEFLIKISKQILTKETNRKICIFVNHIDVLNRVKYKLRKWKVLILNGSVPQKYRQELIDKFNEPNTNYRVFLSITTAGGIGISLHDKDGNYPRTSLILPDLKLINLHQAIGRINRAGMKSPTEIKFIYIKDICNDKNEMSDEKILNILYRKSLILKETMNKNTKNTILPSDYESELVEMLDKIYLSDIKLRYNN